MTAIINRVVTAFVLMVWGSVFSWFYFSGRVESYLHPSFQIFTALSGVLLVVMAAIVLIFGFPDCCTGENCVHTHGGFSGWRIVGVIILVVPILVAVRISPSQFSATTVLNRGYIEDISQLPGGQKLNLAAGTEPLLPGESGQPPAEMPADSYMPKNDKGQIILQTIDFLYAAEEPSMRRDFNGKEVEVTGQFMPAKTKNVSGRRFNLVNMFVLCCAADARPIAVAVEAKKEENFPEMSWVKVTGTATFERNGAKYTPVIIADAITPCDPPEEKFLSN